MSKIIKGHNKKYLAKPRVTHVTNEQNAIKAKNQEFPIEGNCQVSNVVYKCDVTRPLLKRVSWTCRGRMEEQFL